MSGTVVGNVVEPGQTIRLSLMLGMRSTAEKEEVGVIPCVTDVAPFPKIVKSARQPFRKVPREERFRG